MNTTPNTIKAGQTLTARSLCDYECIFSVEIIARKGSFVTVSNSNGPRRVKINKDSDGNECIYAMGKYSMAPMFRALAA